MFGQTAQGDHGKVAEGHGQAMLLDPEKELTRRLALEAAKQAPRNPQGSHEMDP